MLLDFLPPAVQQQLTAQSTFHTYEADSVIFSRGDLPTHLHILRAGMVTICNYAPNGERKVITTISSPGDSFGEVYLFLESQAYDFFAVAQTDCTIQNIPKSLAFSNPDLMALLLTQFARKAYTLNRRVQILSNSSLREKLLMYFQQAKNQHNQVLLPGTRDDLADFLSTTRPSLSRELMRMQDEGLIAVNKKTITLL